MRYKTYWLAAILGPIIAFSQSALAVESTIAAGESHTLFIDGNAVYAMGSNAHGAVKNEPIAVSGGKFYTPQNVGIVGARSVAAGSRRSAALMTDGTVTMWGRAAEPISSTAPPVAPYKLPANPGLGPVTDIAFTIFDFYYVQGGVLFQWKFTGSPVALTVLDVDGPVKSIAAGEKHVVIQFQNGTVTTYGLAQWGEHGTGHPVTTTTEAILKTNMATIPGLSGVVEIAAGRWTSLAKTSNGDVYAWGRNNKASFGDGTTTPWLVPQKVANLSGPSKIFAAHSAVFALMPDGTIKASGWNNLFANGNYTPTFTTLKGIGGVQTIASGWGQQHMFSKGTNGEINGWGVNHNGELGSGSVKVEEHSVVTAYTGTAPTAQQDQPINETSLNAPAGYESPSTTETTGSPTPTAPPPVDTSAALNAPAGYNPPAPSNTTASAETAPTQPTAPPPVDTSAALNAPAGYNPPPPATDTSTQTAGSGTSMRECNAASTSKGSGKDCKNSMNPKDRGFGNGKA